MANTLTGLIPDVYVALDVVSRELTGLIPAVTRDSTADRAAKDQTITLHVAPASAATDIAPGVTPPDDGDQTIGAKTMTISKSRRVPFRWNGEEALSVNNGGHGVLSMQQNQIAQAVRTLVNEVETDLGSLHTKFSRAYGTAGTTPFATAGDYRDATFTNKILTDNGAPGDRHLIMNTAAGATMKGKQSSVDAAGSDSILRQGILLDIDNMSLRESAQINTSVAGTGASATTDAAGYAVGATTITLASAGTGTVVAGDVITLAGDTNQYVVETGDADVSGGGTIVLAAPGLQVAIGASATAITVVAAAARNMAFSRSALVLATRLPALPTQGDMALDREIIVDPRSGLAMELAIYPQYRQVQFELSVAWGYEVIKPEHTALLLG